MIPIPPEAMPVVEILRRDVDRPQEKPETIYESLDTAHSKCLRWYFDDGSECCPMGLHPESEKESPSDCEDFIPSLPRDGSIKDLKKWQKAVQSFGKWWDEQDATTVEEAIDAIWPADLEIKAGLVHPERN